MWRERFHNKSILNATCTTPRMSFGGSANVFFESKLWLMQMWKNCMVDFLVSDLPVRCIVWVGVMCWFFRSFIHPGIWNSHPQQDSPPIHRCSMENDLFPCKGSETGLGGCWNMATIGRICVRSQENFDEVVAPVMFFLNDLATENNRCLHQVSRML